MKVRVVIRFWLREGILVVGVGGLSPGVEQHPGSRIELDLGDLRGRWALVILVVRAVVAERRHSLLLSFVVAVLGITVVGAEDLVVDALALVLVFVLEEGSSFAGGVDVVHILVLMLAGSPEGEVLLRRHGGLREWRSVGGRRQHRVGGMSSVVPEVHGLVLRLAVLELLGLVHAVVPPTRVVVAVVPPARIVA